MAKKGELTRKQQLFIAEYLVDLNASRAALAAGYSPKTAPWIGNENLKKPTIKVAIEEAHAQKIANAGITAEYVLTNLKEMYENHKDGNPSPAIKALELLGKHLSLFSDNLNVRKIQSPEDLTDEEAIAIAKKIQEGTNAGG
jgi:phage terminase small subunit